MFNRIHRRLTRLAELGCLQINDVEHCTEEDLVALETKLGFRLPGVLRELYQWGGNDLGGVFGAGMDVLSLKQHLAHDYALESATNLPATFWSPVTNNVVINGKDGDGWSDEEERRAGTDPLSRLSFPPK